jgi:hypothetical protein
MHEDAESQFKELVEKRDARGKIAGGEMFAFWGILNLVFYSIFIFLWRSEIVWPIMIVIGMAVQIFYVRRLENDSGFRLFWYKNTSQLWLFLVILMPFIFYIFPAVLKIYPEMAIYPLMFLWLSIGLMISGILVEQLCFKLGALVMACACIFTVMNFSMIKVIYPAAVLLGLIVPGIWSRYEQKK